jgi:hypothetical protein
MDNTSNNTNQCDIQLGPMNLYPTLDSLQSVVDLAYSQLPGVPANRVLSLLMTYHNSLIAKLEKETNYVQRKKQ